MAIDWIEYRGRSHCEQCHGDSPDIIGCDVEPELGRTYLVCSETGAVQVKTWYGRNSGGFRTCGIGQSPDRGDDNILYFAEITLPEEMEEIKKYSTTQKLALEVIRLRKIIRAQGGN